MEILFSKNNKPLSRAICSVTKEPVSHCAIRVGDFVLHSTICGPEIRTFEYFRNKNEIIASIQVPLDSKAAISWMTRMDDTGYDYLALAYLGIRYTCKVWLKLPLPKANLWRVSGMYMCTELVTAILFEKADALLTPYQLYLKLR